MTTADADPMCYIGKHADCGCVVAVTVDKPELRKYVASDVARWMRDGLIVERTTVEEARTLLHSCPHQPEPVKASGKRKAARA
jgi:hypothetical protein